MGMLLDTPPSPVSSYSTVPATYPPALSFPFQMWLRGVAARSGCGVGLTGSADKRLLVAQVDLTIARRWQAAVGSMQGRTVSTGIRPMSPRERVVFERKVEREAAEAEAHRASERRKSISSSRSQQQDKKLVAGMTPSIEEEDAQRFPPGAPQTESFRQPPRRRVEFAVPPINVDSNDTAPGDTFGIYETRMPFLRPVRPSHVELFGDSEEMRRLIPPDSPPEDCVASAIIRSLSGALGVSHFECGQAIRECGFDINRAMRRLEEHNGAHVAPGSYGIVALEKYDPETFCVVNYSLPAYESLEDEALLETLYEVTLSAAELPKDVPMNRLVDKLLGGWTTEDGDHIGESLREKGVGVTSVLLLPQGEYSVHGYSIVAPISEHFPNFGSAVACTCIDLRTGIHSRFRRQAERIADTVSDHVVQEALHYGTQDAIHLLRQPLWFGPDHSVEDFLRFKESLLQPSFLIHELRHALSLHHMCGSKPFRNISEMEKLKTMQFKLDKHFKEGAQSTKLFDSESGTPVVLGSGSGMKAGASYYNQQANLKGDSFGDQVTAERAALTSAQVITADERIWQTFYRPNRY